MSLLYMSGGKIVKSGGVLAASSGPQLLQLSNINFQGAFRVNASSSAMGGTPGLGLTGAQGPIAYNSANNSLFIVGNLQAQQVCEVAIPALVNSATLTSLNIVNTPIQSLTSILSKLSSNPQGLDTIGGLSVSGGELLVNAYVYYDNSGSTTQNICSARTASSLSTTNVDGPFSLGNFGALCGNWLSEVPSAWQSSLGANYIAGASNLSIISRCSVGPSAYGFSTTNIVGVPSGSVPNPIPATAYESFPYGATTILPASYVVGGSVDYAMANAVQANKLWTYGCAVGFGMIVPNTRTYACFGTAGGFNGAMSYSGMCYKNSSDPNYPCPSGITSSGWAYTDQTDVYHYVWLFDVNDLISVKNGSLQPYQLRPYAQGQLPTINSYYGQAGGLQDQNGIRGGAYDKSSGTLYLNLLGCDASQGSGTNCPLFAAFTL